MTDPKLDIKDYQPGSEPYKELLREQLVGAFEEHQDVLEGRLGDLPDVASDLLDAVVEVDSARLQLHHTGYSHATEESRDGVIAKELDNGNQTIRCDTSHQRNFTRDQETGRTREEQVWPDGRVSFHWDCSFESEELAREFLWFLAAKFGLEQGPFFIPGSDPNVDPIGVIWFTDQNGVRWGIMARCNEWDPFASLS